MKVFKFGGASVKDANAVKNVAKIVRSYQNDSLVIVISAMGKITNSLERLTKAYFYKSEDPFVVLDEVRSFHIKLMDELFEDKSNKIYDDVNNTLVEIEWIIEDEAQRDFDYEYDQIVSVGELLSTKIISAYLNSQNIANTWVDARDFIQTDNTYREGKLNWELTEQLGRNKLKPHLISSSSGKKGIVITQGFIGGTSENFTTTLGREGSDYSAAIIAYILNAESVTIWKDVSGVLNADPKWFDETQMLDHISYQDAIELAYYGATVIHPKTIKPLQNKNIPLFVKSFVNPENKGTEINNDDSKLPIPSFIFKINQVLISIIPKDFSFIIEENLRDIFMLFAQERVKINVMQNTALKFSICVDFDEHKIPHLIATLKENYNVAYNDNLELVTIRYYDQKTIDRVLVNKQVFLELKSRNTIQMVMKNMG